MTDRPWMPFYFQDFRADTLDLELDEIGVYFILICLAWKNGTGGVTGNSAVLKKTLQACIANFHGHTYNRIVPKLLSRYFELGSNDNVWYQKRVVLELQKARKLSANGRQNVGKRWARHKEFNGLGDTTVIPNAYHHTHTKNYTPTNLEAESGPAPPQAVGEKATIQATEYLKNSVRRKGWPG